MRIKLSKNSERIISSIKQNLRGAFVNEAIARYVETPDGKRLAEDWKKEDNQKDGIVEKWDSMEKKKEERLDSFDKEEGKNSSNDAIRRALKDLENWD
jgi:predicted SnoaL-like aldol condensation-catalyzing enzyme